MPSAFAPSTLQIAPGMQRPPENTRLGSGIAFAIAAHLLLVLALSLNIQWHTQTPQDASAELWAAVPQVAAPHAEEPLAEPSPPQPSPEEVQAQQQAQQQALQAQQDAEIAVAKAKKIEEQKEADRLAALQKEQQRKLDEQKAKEAKELKEKQDKLEQAKLEQQRKDQQVKDAKQSKDSDAKIEAMRRDYMKRILGMAGATGAPTATGNALHNAAPSAAYAGRVVARIRPNIIFNDPAPGNPRAEVEIQVAPDGNIISYKLSKSSGNPAWDRAVQRAIEKTAILPRDENGSVPPDIVVGLKPFE